MQKTFSRIRRKQAFLIYLTFVILLFPGVLISKVFAAGPGRGPGGASEPPRVVVEKITQRDVNPPMEFVGKVEAVQAVELRSRMQGFLEKVAFEEGAYVKEGQLLYVIENAPYVAQVNVFKAKVAKAQAKLHKANKYLKRAKSVPAGVVAEADMETAEANQLQAQAELQEAKANLAQSQLSLGYTTITAPIAGRIGATAYTKGDFVGLESGTLAKIVQTGPIRVVFSFSETMLPEIKDMRLEELAKNNGKNPILRLRLPNGDLYPLAGRPEFLDNEVDARTGTIAVRGLFANPQGFLVPGQYVKVLIKNQTPKLMAMVPQTAVLEDRKGRYVYVVDEQNVVGQRRITTGPAMAAAWSVSSGLTPGEMVVVEGVQKVIPGQKVKPVTIDENQVGAL